jgi:hypothetical protein
MAITVMKVLKNLPRTNCADVQGTFLPLPKVLLLLLFWDAEAEEGFAPQAHWLFDASVTHYLNLEAMLFLVEHLMERLMGE